MAAICEGIASGAREVGAATGDDAKQVLGEHADAMTLLFSDVEMPGETNGFALARYIAEHWPAIEIVIASGRISLEPGDMPEKTKFIQSSSALRSCMTICATNYLEQKSPNH